MAFLLCSITRWRLCAVCREASRQRFFCPLAKHVNRNALSYRPDGYHPFVETLREYAAGGSDTYEGSVLRKYYEVCQPDSAGEAIVGFQEFPEVFRECPSYLFDWTPWRSHDREEIDRMIRGWIREDYREHIGDGMSLDADGSMAYGPVSLRKGRLEYQRLVAIYESLKANGYDRSRGHAHFLLLRRGDSYRFVSKGQGNHRTAAMVALGHETIPAVFSEPYVIDVSMVDYWPQVRRGVWSRAQAEAYVAHLFRFDDRTWARERSVVLGGNQSQSNG